VASLRLAVAGPISIGLSLFTSRAQTFLLLSSKEHHGERDPALEEEDPGNRANEVEENRQHQMGPCLGFSVSI
jgi:hypothetical protein